MCLHHHSYNKLFVTFVFFVVLPSVEHPSEAVIIRDSLKLIAHGSWLLDGSFSLKSFAKGGCCHR